MASIVDLECGQPCVSTALEGNATNMQLALKMTCLTSVSAMRATLEMDSIVPADVGKMNAID